MSNPNDLPVPVHYNWTHSLPTVSWPDPTEEMLNSPEFEAIWQAIKTWDINVPGAYHGYCGATGNHVRAILEALNELAAKKRNDDMLLKERLKKAEMNIKDFLCTKNISAEEFFTNQKYLEEFNKRYIS